MGLHRDGGKWNLADEVVEDRRRVFWECRSAEVFQVSADCHINTSECLYQGELLLKTVSHIIETGLITIGAR